MAFRALVRLLRWQTPWNEVAPSLRISPRAFGRRDRAERSATVGEAARFSAARARSVWFRCRRTSSPPRLETSVAFPMTCPSAGGSRLASSERFNRHYSELLGFRQDRSVGLKRD
jgi:hypothetical protein